ncbi:MAG: Ribosomal protein L7Ae/L30e/S12e/Gadd45 [Desulfotomaculum sp. 46_296]|nr:MAG: Ribosomal protein L7Ae/L30e/S12e/Gadd45 [Desulfotomaculum sp. 46_296]HAU31854.1 50S ribosomal protein L7Ae-like protein [Desulfotomaculum sp.]
MSLADLQQSQKKTVGSKQTLKAVKRGQVKVVYIALDAEKQVTQVIIQACQSQGIPVVEVETMYSLGRICGIEVGCAVAAILDL